MTRYTDLDGLIADLVDDNLGVYPASINGVKRTEWQNGWNACLEEKMNLEHRFREWLSGLQPTTIQALSDSHIFALYNEGEPRLYVLANDVFYWACSDAEEITEEEIPELLAELETYPKWGEVRWVCFKRNMRPQKPMADKMKEDGEWGEHMEALPPRTDPYDHGWPKA